MSSEVAVAVHEVSKWFPIYSKPHHRLLQILVPRLRARWHDEFQALARVDFSIPRGQTVGIVGRNGSGKSTLLQIICGTLQPSAGSVEVKGRVAALLELGAGFNPEFTGRENVYLNGSVLGLSRAEIDERFADIEAFADIGDFVDQPVKTYSSGMYVRLAFSVAINVTPDILIVDEALSVGDEAFQRKCFARIEAIRNSGATVLFVSHSASAVVDLCDRAILLDHGEVLADGAPKHVIAQYQKLLYTPADRIDEVRDQLRGTIEGATAATGVGGGGARARDHAVATAFWQDGLVPTSTVAYESRGARIADVRLETVEGKRVNVLVPADWYVMRYEVAFDMTLTGVRFGMLIRTITGIELGGAAYPAADEPFPVIEAGSVVQVAVRFRCQLAPGTYFLNAGVLAHFNEGAEYAHRLVDVAMFRVMPTTGRHATALVDFDVEPVVTIST